MSDTDLKVIIKAKELAVHTFKLTSSTNRYPKKYRYALVPKIQNKCLEIYTTLFEANRISNQTHKRLRLEMITQGITYCDELLFFIELSMNIGLLSKQTDNQDEEPQPNKTAEYWSKMVSDVKHMALAWRKSEQQ